MACFGTDRDTCLITDKECLQNIFMEIEGVTSEYKMGGTDQGGSWESSGVFHYHDIGSYLWSSPTQSV